MWIKNFILTVFIAAKKLTNNMPKIIPGG